MVVSDLPQFEALRDGVVRVPPGDTTALAAAVNSLLAQPALADRLVLRGQQMITEEFSAAIMADRYRALYDSVLSGHPPLATSW